jgi:radical SAM family uncharacterized protein
MQHILEKILPHVQKPSRYTGGEWNAIIKEWSDIDVKIAFAFPDIYEVGMSHLGLQILYHVVNSRRDALMERVFAPWTDMEGMMRKHSIPLFSLESRRRLADFDIVAFTLQYEMTFSNVLNMLDMAGLPIRSAARNENHPIVIAGGPCAFNPEPLADFVDAFVIGEGEEVLGDIIDLYKTHRDIPRQELLKELAGIGGVYVPSLYHIQYCAGGAVASFMPEPGVPERVLKRVLSDFDRAPFPSSPVVPFMGVVHDRIMLEVLRGCTRGCRFCQAGVIYRPVREKKPETLLRQAREIVQNTGYDEISLASLSTADYSLIKSLVTELLNHLEPEGVGVSLPSLRVDAFSVDLAKEVQRVRRSSLTFAPEAGSQRLRDVINKGVTEENLLDAVTAAFDAGWHAVKLYFMIGLPGEREEDLDGIAELAVKVLQAGLMCRAARGRLKVTVSASSFVPKSHTAFQWEPQDTLGELKRKQSYLKEKLKKEKKIAFNWHDPETSFLEAVLARGDRRLGVVLESAWRSGARFDGWSECFNYDLWHQAFRQNSIDPGEYAYRRFNYEDVLPWDHIDAGVDKKYLIKEHKRALAGVLTPDCRGGRCPGCGLCPALEIKPELPGGDDFAPLQDSL